MSRFGPSRSARATARASVVTDLSLEVASGEVVGLLWPERRGQDDRRST